ncbi:MAG: hypothetical protein IKL76_01840 [Clostridia bacterium]|nr:hypothetical protein [Clostridia bacterium]
MEKTQHQFKETVKTQAYQYLRLLREFFNSYIFYVLETLLACAFVLFRQEVFGVIVFIGLLAVLLVVCEDVLPTTLPFLLVCTFSTNCYDSFDTFIGYAIYAPVVVVALIAHFVMYHKPYYFGESMYGICAVSIAILLGGIGNFGFLDYVYGGYYMLGLGIGMVVAYYFMKSQFSARREYDIRKRFAVIMTLMGMLCVAMIAIGRMREWFGFEYIIQGGRGFSPNNLATMLMFAMPFPLYLTKKSDWWAILTATIYAGICFTSSRGGLIFGSIEFVVCCAYWIYITEKKTQRILYCVFIAVALLLSIGGTIIDVIFDRFVDESMVGSSRWVMILESIDRFKGNPIFGSGILDDTLNYSSFKKKGTMSWYHMMIPQIIGSMGLVGVVAYAYQGFARFKMIFTKMSSWSLVLGISYLGILMMSQVNPGEFCPLPFELLTVLLFILQELRLEQDSLPLGRQAYQKQKSGYAPLI